MKSHSTTAYNYKGCLPNQVQFRLNQKLFLHLFLLYNFFKQNVKRRLFQWKSIWYYKRFSDPLQKLAVALSFILKALKKVFIFDVINFVLFYQIYLKINCKMFNGFFVKACTRKVAKVKTLNVRWVVLPFAVRDVSFSRKQLSFFFRGDNGHEMKSALFWH